MIYVNKAGIAAGFQAVTGLLLIESAVSYG